MLITLTTDFGTDSPYVAQMKAVILAMQPAAAIVDITHAIGPQNILQGAAVVQDTAPWFPPNTIHVAVVDPGVGTARRLLLAPIGQHLCLAPDNGLLSGLMDDTPPTAVFSLENSHFWRPTVSPTFHGRDILAPVAAHLSRGVLPHELGPPIDDWQRLPGLQPQVAACEIRGQIVAIDAFGNLLTNLRRRDFPTELDFRGVSIRIGDHRLVGLATTYGDHAPGTPLALFGSSTRLELACVNGSAARHFAAHSGDRVEVNW